MSEPTVQPIAHEWDCETRAYWLINGRMDEACGRGCPIPERPADVPAERPLFCCQHDNYWVDGVAVDQATFARAVQEDDAWRAVQVPPQPAEWPMIAAAYFSEGII